MGHVWTFSFATILMSSTVFAHSEELCDWFPSGPGGEEKTYICIQQLGETRGLLSIRSPHGSRSCDASIKGTYWTSRCKISTEITFDGLTFIKENAPLEFSVYMRLNPETNRPAATLDFHSPQHGINGWKRWNMNAQ